MEAADSRVIAYCLSEQVPFGDSSVRRGPAERRGDVKEVDDGWPRTNGELHEGGLVITFGGACPVQGYGSLDGRGVYFRARHDVWRVEVYGEGVEVDGYIGLPKEPPEWVHHGTHDHAGWMRPDETIAALREALAAYRARLGGSPAGGEGT